ncbi:phage holin family protein [Escherichia coli]
MLNVALHGYRADALFYRRGDSRHKPLMSWLAWLLMYVCLCAPQLSVWSPVSPTPGRLEVFFNLYLLCVLVIRARQEDHKNLAHCW